MKSINLKSVLPAAATLACILLCNAPFSSSFVSSASSNYNRAANNVSPKGDDTILMGKMLETDAGCTLEQSGKNSNFAIQPFFQKAIASIAAVCFLTLGISAPAFADEYGRETEMDLLPTGETVMICVKRGPLGACTKTERRTADNENDKSDLYFQEPKVVQRRKDDDENEGNLLIEKLKQRSEDNYEKNQQLVYQRTQLNDAGANFGPFDGNTLILNEDGKGFTLLANPQAMRLKKAGFIGSKKQFIKQPTQEEIDAALESGPNLLDRILGNS